MRSVLLMGACLLAACSTQTVRCGRHLTPINVPRPIAGAASSHPKTSSAGIGAGAKGSPPATGEGSP